MNTIIEWIYLNSQVNLKNILAIDKPKKEEMAIEFYFFFNWSYAY